MSEKTDEGQNRNELEAKLKSKQRTYKNVRGAERFFIKANVLF